MASQALGQTEISAKPVAHAWIPANILPASFWKNARHQYSPCFPSLYRVTRGADTLGTSMLCLWCCGSRGSISLVYTNLRFIHRQSNNWQLNSSYSWGKLVALLELSVTCAHLPKAKQRTTSPIQHTEN